MPRGGKAAIIPERGAKRLLVQCVSGQVEEREMLPLGKRQKFPALTGEEILGLRSWIDQRAKWLEGLERRGTME